MIPNMCFCHFKMIAFLNFISFINYFFIDKKKYIYVFINVLRVNMNTLVDVFKSTETRDLLSFEFF